MPEPFALKPTPSPNANLFGVEVTPADGDQAKARKKKQAAAAAGISNGGLDSGLPANLGKSLAVEVPDFSDPNRPKTCLEVDFPLVPINALSALEGNAGKPIYQMSKWWARRRSCVFRALLLAAAMKAPTRKHPDGQPMLGVDGNPIIDEDSVDRAVWDAYYANHQAAGNFKNLKVLDPFMGGGTTLVEGSRLGFQVAGVDLNPVAWFIVKNELACTDPAEVKAFFEQIDAEVKPQIQPFYVTDGVGGKKGRWFEGDKAVSEGFDPTSVPPAERKRYRYEGPEIVCTFWAKHGHCSKPGCNHRTPIFRSPIIATKKLGVKYISCTCKNKECGITFHAELGDARIAPDAEHIVLDNEHPYSVLSPYFTSRLLSYMEGDKGDKINRIHELSERVEAEPGLNCPSCGTWSGQSVRDVLAMHRRASRASDIDKKHLGIIPARNAKKTVHCTLLIDPDWLRGSPGMVDGSPLGGHIDASVEASSRWYAERLRGLRHIEIRGTIGDSDASTAELPGSLTDSTGREIDTTTSTTPGDGAFTCQACGLNQPVLTSAETLGHVLPEFPYAIQALDRDREVQDFPYGGRFFKPLSAEDSRRLLAAQRDWLAYRDTELSGHWPTSEVPFGNRTHVRDPIHRHGYTHWARMFNTRQLLGLATLHLAIYSLAGTVSDATRDQALGAFVQFLRNQCVFCIWNIQRDTLEPFFSNNNYNPKLRSIENNLFASIGRGNWRACTQKVIEALEWSACPWEPSISSDGSTVCLQTGDQILPGSRVTQGSATELPAELSGGIDLVITDPPFGDLIDYAELADFFFVWLRLGLSATDDRFRASFTPKSMEIVTNPVRNPEDPDGVYSTLLTAAWAECHRALKPSGLLAFTFHHSEDEPWLAVLRSLLDAGFLLEATYPVRSDETKGEGAEFGSKKIEYDIIHVCRKRLEDPKPVSWPKMRQWVKAELSRLRPLLESYKNRGLQDADVRVILRGKALEFFSRHYGQVLVSAPGGEGTPLSIRDALLGINQLLDESSGQPGERPPSLAQPVVYQFLRLFGAKSSLGRDEVSKLLRGTAVQQRDFAQYGWVSEEEKVVRRVPVYERFQKMRLRSRRELKTELDQAHFLIGAALPPKAGDTGVNIEKELERDTFLIRPGVEALLDWYSKTPASADEPGAPAAAGIALQLLRAAFEAKRARMRQDDPMLFEEWESAAAAE